MQYRSLSDALEALLYQPGERDAFFAGDRSRFVLSPEDEDALQTIDRDQLLSAAKLARMHILERRHRGVGSLLEMFQKTLSSWKAEDPTREVDDLARAFVASAPFDAYRTNAFGGRGLCLEEAFFRFAEEHAIGSEPVRHREYALAVLRGLATVVDPSFVVPEIVRRAPRGYYVVLPHGPTLMALLDGKFIEGPITPFIAEVLTEPHDPGRPRDRNPERAAVDEELTRLGLIAPRTLPA
jgi:hypothetical protein